MINALCVLRSGGAYTPKHVQRLHHQWKQHFDGDYNFVCLNDVLSETTHIDGVDYIPLAFDWPGWWAKVEMYRPDLEGLGRILYMDLDNTIVGDMSEIAAYDGTAAAPSDFNYPSLPSSCIINFAPGAMRHLWDTFMSDRKYWMTEGDKKRAPHYGDQILLTKVYGPSIDRFQDLVPGQVLSYKRDCRDGVPQGARIIQFHGTPKPWDVTL